MRHLVWLVAPVLAAGTPSGAMVITTLDQGSSASSAVAYGPNGSYGSLVGKAVALEPATGASFDTPLEPGTK